MKNTRRFAGTARITLFIFAGELQFSTNGATFGHNAGSQTIGVAAVDVHTTGCPPDGPLCAPFVGGSSNPVEPFSADGPRRILYNPDGSAITPGNFLSTGGTLLLNSDIAAANVVMTATPTLNPITGLPLFEPFYGTSAAAPHAAAIAALMLSGNPQLTPATLKQKMTSTALVSQNPGPYSLSGAGITDALNAVAAVMPQPDFNGDGHADLIWQNVSTGERSVWFMNGITPISTTIFTTVPTEWQALD